MNARDERLSSEFASQCQEARATLERHMAERGLRERDGWRIYEFTRQVDGRTELVMRPIHSHLNAPSELECACIIDEPGANITSECRS
ncbi:MAG TPA: hypothetical protein VM051_01040 [Usitatibacter sp.]|nr:hypothetical protein [Usitatibacter sp.]